jgi:hypothetical protein
MIGVSPLLLWPADDLLELMPVEIADSPQALLGDACAAFRADQDSAVSVVFPCDALSP